MNGYGYNRPMVNPVRPVGTDPGLIQSYKAMPKLPARHGRLPLDEQVRQAETAKASGDPTAARLWDDAKKAVDADIWQRQLDQARKQGEIKQAQEEGYPEAPVQEQGPPRFPTIPQQMRMNEVGPMPYGGARAKGGPMDAGKAYLVGEAGPEIVVPREPGVVIPNSGPMPQHPNDAPSSANPYVTGGQFRDPTSGTAGPMPTSQQTAPASGPMPSAPASSRSMPTVFDIGLQAGQKRGGPMSSSPTTWHAPDQVEEAMKGMRPSEKKKIRSDMKMGIAKASMDDAISLDKQAKGAIGEWEALKMSRKALGLPDVDPEIEKQFYNGNVQRQLAMTSQLKLVNNEHLNKKAGDEGYARQQQEKQDERLWQTERTKEERAYDEKRKATQTAEQRAAAANWQPLKVGGRDTGYATNELGNLINMRNGDPVELKPEQIAAIRKDGGRVTIGPEGTRVTYGAEDEAKEKRGQITQIPGPMIEDPVTRKMIPGPSIPVLVDPVTGAYRHLTPQQAEGGGQAAVQSAPAQAAPSWSSWLDNKLKSGK